MKSLLVIFAVIGLGACQWGAQPGLPQDTPEVAAAKAAHLAALAQANSQPQQQQWAQPQQNWNQQPQQSWNQPQQQQWSPPQQQWRGPVALPPGFDQNGAPLPVQDTPEVQAERAKHFSLYSSGQHITAQPQQQQWNSPQPQWNPAPQQNWNAPQQQWNAAPQSWNSQPGLPQETPEVAAARAAHFAAHSQLQG